MYLLNRSQITKSTCSPQYLHSTMYLLNQVWTQEKALNISKFTFHYVSIKSLALSLVCTTLSEFTFHYVSIKSVKQMLQGTCMCQFTFHYVSIKSISDSEILAGQGDLHSTMYLLNPVPQHLIISQAYFVLFCRPTIIHCNKICIHQKLSLFTA